MPRTEVVRGLGGPSVQRVGPRDRTMPCPSFLVEHERGFILFDSGLSPRGLADPEGYFPDVARLFDLRPQPELGVDRQLAGLGLTPDRIAFVVPSHLHFDHTGGLY